MEHRLDDGRIHPDSTGKLLAGERTAVLPKDARDFDALRLSQLRDAAVEQAPALRIGFGMEFCVIPLLKEYPGIFGFLFRQILFPYEQECDESPR